jgi:hypothetical protein
MLRLTGVQVGFLVHNPNGKKRGTTVDLTLRRRNNGQVLAHYLNAGQNQDWQLGDTPLFHLQVIDDRLQTAQLGELCMRLSWFPERDEDLVFDLSVIVYFTDGASIDRCWAHQKVADRKQFSLDLFPL